MRNTKAVTLHGAFHGLVTAYKVYMGEVDGALSDYRAGVADVDHARSRISAAGEALSCVAVDMASTLELFIFEQLSEPVWPAVRAQLDVFEKYDILPTPAELRLLMRASRGHYTSLRAIAGYAARHGYAVAVPGIDGFIAEVEEIRSMHAETIHYCPDGFIAEACATFPDSPEAAAFVSDTAALNAALGKYETGVERWLALFVACGRDWVYTHDDFENTMEYLTAQQSLSKRREAHIAALIDGVAISAPA